MFDGTTSLDTFLAKVNNCREYYEWSEKDTVHHLRASLEGSAGQVLWECGGSAASLDTIVALLRNRFGNQNQTERYRSELGTRRRAKGESLQSVYQDIRRLAALSFPGQTGAAPGSVYEIVARDAFLTAIDNPSIRHRILERDPPPDTLDAALSAAVRLEALDATEHNELPTRSIRHGSATQQNVRSSSPLLAAGHNTSDSRLQVLESGMQTLGSSLAAIQEQLMELARRPPVSAPDRHWQAGPTGSGQVAGPVPHDPGRVPQSSGPSTPRWPPASAPGGAHRGRGGGGRLPRDVCRICHQQGHWGNECPTQRPPSAQGAAANARGVHPVLPASDTYLQIFVKGKGCNALIDTGSERSLMPRRLVPTVVLKPSTIKLYAANETEITNLGTMVLRYQVQGQTLETELVVSNDIDELIFGFDWLLANECYWHFGDGILYVQGQPVRLRTRHSRTSVRRIPAVRAVMTRQQAAHQNRVAEPVSGPDRGRSR